MIKVESTIVNKLGMHARPAAKLVTVASRFQSTLRIYREDESKPVDAKSIMSVMLLAASCGTRLWIEAEGPDEEQASGAIVALIESGFDE